MRHGDLNGVTGGNAVDPLNGAPFPGNRIPDSRISGVASTLLGRYYPAPNVSVPAAELNYRVQRPVGETRDGYDVRLDQMISPRQQMFVRWTQQYYEASWNLSFQLPLVTLSAPGENLVLSDTYTPRPNVSNEFRFGLSLYWPKSAEPLRGKDVVANLGLQGLDLRNVGDKGGFPLFDFSAGTGFWGIGIYTDEITNSRTFQTADTLSWIRSRHTVRLGAEVRRIGERRPLGGDDFGSYVFSSGAFRDRK